jgi:PAP2 superfamily
MTTMTTATINRSRARIAFLAFVAAALVLAAVAAATAHARADKTSKAPVSAQVALDWNATAVDAVRAARTLDGVPPGSPPRALFQPEGLLYLSYVQAAVYDAVTHLDHRYEPYHRFKANPSNASLQAAVIAASYHTLVYYLGDPGGVLATQYAAALAALPADESTAHGIAVGAAAAADIAALRANDGRNAIISTPYGQGPAAPGLWVFAPPPSLQSAQTPWLAFMQPWTLTSSAQFRAPPPPALASAQYATDLSETRAYGAQNSAVRTPEQTAIAYFWNANVINQYNQTLRAVATQHGMDLVDTARLLAMGMLVTADAGMACWDAKYTYQFWRPITAIRNDPTAPDPTWSPLLTTPNHPEYPSAHGCVTSALAAVLAHALGTTAIDVTIPGAQGGATTLTTTRHFATVAELDSQVIDARVWIGFHYRTSVVAGEDLGAAVADWALQRSFLPSDNQGDNQGESDSGDNG